MMKGTLPQDTSLTIENISQHTTDDTDKKELINQLVAEIVKHQQYYYNGTPRISDGEFDVLWDRARVLNPNHEIFKRVGEDFSEFFRKKKHIMPMGSLDKVSHENQFSAWVHSHKSDYYLVQYKLDGASLELQYERGTLVAAVTRGDGKFGDDIIVNARNMQGVLRTLPVPVSCAIRGEVIMTHDVHARYFPDKANCRNAANGLMKRKDGNGVKFLQVFCYDIVTVESSGTGDIENIHMNNQLEMVKEKEKLALLKEYGCIVVPYQICDTEQAVHTFREQVIKERDTVGYDIDGLVVKMPHSDIADMATLRPDRQVAYKFPLEIGQTKLIDVEWSESGHLYTPIAILEPVQLAGTLVKRANLVHLDHINELGVKLYSEVLVTKRGEIIPKVEKVVFSDEHCKEIMIPDICGTCGAVVVNEGTRIYCPNVQCLRRLLFRVLRWINIHKIDYWGNTLVHRFVMEENIIRRVGDLYRLTAEQLSAIDRIATPLAQKLLHSLHIHKTVSFSHFIASLGIEGIALRSAEKLVLSGYTSWDALRNANAEQLSDINDIGPTLAKNIVESVSLLHEEVTDVLQFITIENTEISQIQQLPLYGQSFCFTGAMTISRKEAERQAVELGGMVKKSVTKTLTFLVTNNKHSNSEKNKKAHTLGVQVINEEDFISLISSSATPV